MFRALLVARGYTRWPKGKELEQVAKELDISRTVAYDAKQAGPLLPPRTSCTTKAEREPVKNPQVRSAILTDAKVRPTGQVRPTGLPKVRPTGLSGRADQATTALAEYGRKEAGT